jgi:RimJ/RimL family protein N-acetyltransferase
MMTSHIVMRDTALTFWWRCDADTVRFSKSGRVPTPDEHRKWMAERVINELARVVWDDIPKPAERVGMYKLVIESQHVASLGYTIAPELRGLGYAKLVRAESIRHLRQIAPAVRTLRSTIHVENERSLRVAMNAGAKVVRTENGWTHLETAL